MTRKEFQDLAEVRAKEATALFDAGFYDGAYYLAGYAIECALKACIAKQFRAEDLPPKRTVEKTYTHDLATLVELAGINKAELNDLNSTLGQNWGIVKTWNEQSRYEQGKSKQGSSAMCSAVTDLANGVLIWLKKSW